MSSWRKKVLSFYRIFTKVVAVAFIIILVSHIWKISAQVVHYQEYIKGERNLGDRRKIEEGAQNLAEIKEIEKAILTEVELKLQKKGKKLQKNQELEQAKERLTEAEEECKKKKEVREKEEEKYQALTPKSPDTFSSEEQKINDEYGKAWAYEKSAENHRQKELENVRQKVIKNIQNELKRADLTITELDIEFVADGKKWEKRSWYWSLFRDMPRFFLIKPCQTISRWFGITSWIFLDLLLKVLIMRLLLNWISYPPILDLDFVKSQEKTEPTDLASLEEEREQAMKQLKTMKQFIFNIGMSFFLIQLFSWHPFAFDRSNPFFRKLEINFLWIILYFIISVVSNFSFYKLYGKKNITPKGYLQKYWIMVIFILAFSFIYLQKGRSSADYLFALLSEVINILINLAKIAYRRSGPLKKEKIKWEQKRVWSYKNYKS